MEIEWIKKLHPIIRWVLVIPAIIIDYFIVLIVINLLLTYFFGPVNPQSVALKKIIFIANSEFFAIFSALLFGCIVAPKGKVILSSVFLGMVLVFIGMQATLTYNNISPIHGVANWETYLSLAFNALAALCSTLLIIFNKFHETKFQSIITRPNEL